MRRRCFILGAAALGLAGCAGPVTVTGSLPPQGPYHLASGDRLRVIVFGQDSLSNLYAVDGSGRIAMPLIGAVPAAGRTTADLERAIEGQLRAGYVREPKVTVEVEQYRPFYVLGEVTTSGQFPFVNGMTVQTAIAIAGGYTPRADKSVALITRPYRGQLVTAEVPLNAPVFPGDTVMIKERWF